MLQAVADLIKELFIPGSFAFLLFGLTAGVLLGYGPRPLRRFALPFLALLAVGYWLGSLPSVSDALATRFFAADARSLGAEDVADAKAIVVLGAGVASYVSGEQSATIPALQTALNAFEAARVYRLLPRPVPVIASGGVVSPEYQTEPESEVLRDLLVRAGVPAAQIVLESKSRTTHEQAMEVAPLLHAHHWEPVVLVVPPVQMPRAAAVFAAQGVKSIRAPAPFRAPSTGTLQMKGGWVPNGGALNAAERAVYDYLAWMYYWMRGWL